MHLSFKGRLSVSRNAVSSSSSPMKQSKKSTIEKQKQYQQPIVRPLVAMDSDVTPPELPQNYSFYSFQIAGHHYSKQKDESFGVLTCEKTGHVLKPMQKPPRGTSEMKFYENVWTDHHSSHVVDSPKNETLRKLRAFVPRYFGCKEITSNGRTSKFLVLENVTGAHEKPCVVDIKIGARTWDPLATLEKIDYEKSKYPHAQTLGFRFLGTMVFKETTDEYEHHDKKWGKMLTENDILPAFQSYFPKEIRSSKILAACVLRKLHQILHLFSTQRSFAFYSSSVLISYEGSNLVGRIDQILSSLNNEIGTGEEKNANKSSSAAATILQKFDALNCIPPPAAAANRSNIDEQFFSAFEPLLAVKMIDFTHVFEQKVPIENVQDQPPLDENYLHGLKNVIKYLTRFLDSLVL